VGFAVAAGALFGEARTRADDLPTLRGVFLSHGATEEAPNAGSSDQHPTKHPTKHPTIGRLGIRLLEDDAGRLVAPDHLFRSRDRIIFEVSTNRSGWLYVLHRGPDGRTRHLWPQEYGPRSTPTNRIADRMTIVVPSGGDVFAFDDEPGREIFYIFLRSSRAWPTLEDAGPQKPPPPREVKTPDQGTTIISNFLVRGPSGLLRGVTYVPDTRENDDFVYFASADRTIGADAVIELRLQHQR
jgi:hypothetical protein